MRWFLLFLAISNVFADEQVRQVQEELRKRNLYFGDIDGQARPELANALRRYQARKGFAVTGTISEETATSLSVATRPAADGKEIPLPDVPVLRSDNARELSLQQRIALEKQAQENPDYVSTPPSPAEAPAPTAQINPARFKTLIQEYLRDSEGDDINAQTKYFDYPVEYFDHGLVGTAFVQKDVTNYVKRWPERKYTLLEPINIGATDKAGETLVQFPVTFQVRNRNHTAIGRTMNFWTLRTDGDGSKIISIREQRLRE